MDANILLYAVNSAAPHHADSCRWLDQSLGGADTVGFTWGALTAFVRVSTKAGLFPRPLSLDDALAQVHAWLGAPGASLLQTHERHFHALADLLRETRVGGNLVSDAHLAAYALTYHADTVSYDHDFARFTGVRCFTPAELLR